MGLNELTLSCQVDGLPVAGLLPLLLGRLGESKEPTGSAGSRVFKLNPITSWDQILGIGIPPKENISGKTGVDFKVLLPQSRSEPQMKGKFGVGGGRNVMMGRVASACV